MSEPRFTWIDKDNRSPAISRNASRNTSRKTRRSSRNPNRYVSLNKSVKQSSKKTPKTYIYLGHGNELSLTNDKQVPRGCTLSTITESGIDSYSVVLFALGSLARDYSELLNDPITNKEELKLKCRGIGLFDPSSPIGGMLIEGVYHLKEQDFWYKDKYCDFLWAFEKPGNQVKIQRSGLYEINTPGLDLPRIESNMVVDSATIMVNTKGAIQMRQIESLYRGSIYPTISTIKKHIKRICREKNDLRQYDSGYVLYTIFVEALRRCTPHKLSTLMKMYKGNHYYFGCRCQPGLTSNQQNALSRERAISFENGNTKQPGLLMRKNNYKRLLQKIFISLFNREKERITHPTTQATVINLLLDRYIESNGLDIADHIRVKSIIRLIDTALSENKIIESDMDPTLLKRINETRILISR